MAKIGERIAIASHQLVGDVVHSLRHRVFVENQGFGLDMVATDLDSASTHIVFWAKDEALGCISMTPPKKSRDRFSQYDLPVVVKKRAALISKLAIVPERRGGPIAHLFVGCVDQVIADWWECRYAVSILTGLHRGLIEYYRELACFEEVARGEGPYGEEIVLVADRLSSEFKALRESELTPGLQHFMQAGGQIVFES